MDPNTGEWLVRLSEIYRSYVSEVAGLQLAAINWTLLHWLLALVAQGLRAQVGSGVTPGQMCPKVDLFAVQASLLQCCTMVRHVAL